MLSNLFRLPSVMVNENYKVIQVETILFSHPGNMTSSKECLQTIFWEIRLRCGLRFQMCI